MNTAQTNLTQYNMVVVFKELRFTQVLYELAIKILQEHPSPLITQIPNQLLSIVYPDRNINCQYANRRLQVSDNRASPPGEHPFGLIVTKAIEAAIYPTQKYDEKIIAYGYNYFLDIKEENATKYISSRFFSDSAKIQNTFNGDIKSIGFESNIFIKQKKCLAKFVLSSQPDSTNIIKTQINFHYEGQTPTSNPQELNQQAISQYDEFIQILRQL